MGVVLGDFPGKKLIHFGAVEMLTTILLCYTIAVKEGHVKAWLPTISACGDHPPEQYFFRYGILVGAMLLLILALYIYAADFSFSHNSVNVGLGVTAALCLGVVAVCGANEDDIVHTSEYTERACTRHCVPPPLPPPLSIHPLSVYIRSSIMDKLFTEYHSTLLSTFCPYSSH